MSNPDLILSALLEVNVEIEKGCNIYQACLDIQEAAARLDMKVKGVFNGIELTGEPDGDPQVMADMYVRLCADNGETKTC